MVSKNVRRMKGFYIERFQAIGKMRGLQVIQKMEGFQVSKLYGKGEDSKFPRFQVIGLLFVWLPVCHVVFPGHPPLVKTI